MTHRDSYEPDEGWREKAAPRRSEDRERFRLPTKMPLPLGENRKIGFSLSVVIHALIVLILLLPMLLTPAGRSLLVHGAGGDGPRGGGGGGMGPREGLRYIRIAPEPAPQSVTPTITPTVKPLVTPPVTPPVVQPPVPTPQPDAKPTATAPVSPDASGNSGGVGTTTGAGPGSGGGIGSGVGTGTGSSVGPGTGGGNDANYPPQPINTPLPPLPVPQKIRPFTVTAEFDVDSTGRVLNVEFNETPDGGYNRKLKKMFSDMRFRPGVRPDGSPIRSKGQVILFL